MSSPPPKPPNGADPDRSQMPTSTADDHRPNAALSDQSIPAIQKLWVGGNTLGFAIVTIILVRIAVSPSSTPEMMPGIEALFLSEIIVGSCVGTVQALILKRRMLRLRIWQWVLASILGGYLGIAVWGLVMFLLFSAPIVSGAVNVIGSALLTATLFGGMIGASVGFGQTLILGQLLALPQRARSLRRWWWANVVGRSLGWLSAMLAGLFLIISRWAAPLNSDLGPSFLALLVCSSVGGLVYSGITAAALPYLTPRSPLPRST